jgi:hypothetical protein
MMPMLRSAKHPIRLPESLVCVLGWDPRWQHWTRHERPPPPDIDPSITLHGYHSYLDRKLVGFLID